MRARGLVAELAFLALVGGSLAAPALMRSGQDLAASGGSSGSSSSGSSSSGSSSSGSSSGSSSSGSSGSSGSGSSGGSSGGSNGSSSSDSGSGPSGSGSGTSSSDSGSGTTTGTPPGGTTTGGTTGGTGNGSSDASSSSEPRTSGADLSAYTEIPAQVGTVLYATFRNLPPFLVLGCLLGAIGVEIPDGPFGVDPLSATNAACSRFSIRPLRDLTGPFSDPPRRVSASEIELKITVDSTNHVVVEPSLPSQRQNRLLLTLLAAALIVILGLATALVQRGRRPSPPGGPPAGYHPYQHPQPPYPYPPQQYPPYPPPGGGYGGTPPPGWTPPPEQR